MSIEIARVNRALGPGWSCGAVVRLAGQRIRLHLKPIGTFDPFSDLLIIEAEDLQQAIALANDRTHAISVEEAQQRSGNYGRS